MSFAVISHLKRDSLSFVLFVDLLKSKLSYPILYKSYSLLNTFIHLISSISVEGGNVGLKSVADITLYHITFYSLTLQALTYCLSSLPSLSPFSFSYLPSLSLVEM